MTNEQNTQLDTSLNTHDSIHQQNLQAAAAAAMALLSEQKNLLTKQELAKLNLDVKNFSLDHYQQLAAAAAVASANGLTNGLTNDRTTSRKQQHTQKQQRIKKSPSIDDSISDDCYDNTSLESNNNNNTKLNKKQLKGNSISSSPRETSCSEETHSDNLIKSETPSSSCSSSTHDCDTQNTAENGTNSYSRSITPSSSRSISPSYRDCDNSSLSSTTAANAYSSLDSDVLAKLGGFAAAAAAAGYSNMLPTNTNGSSSTTTTTNGSLSPSTGTPLAPETLAAAMTTAANAVNLPLTSNVATILATRKRRNERTDSDRNKKIKPVPQDKKDDAYWERRRKNNEAAKRSRDLRRQKEDEIAVRAAFLEQENLKLRAQVTILKTELSKLHFMIYNR